MALRTYFIKFISLPFSDFVSTVQNSSSSGAMATLNLLLCYYLPLEYIQNWTCYGYAEATTIKNIPTQGTTHSVCTFVFRVKNVLYFYIILPLFAINMYGLWYNQTLLYISSQIFSGYLTKSTTHYYNFVIYIKYILSSKIL